jgi:virulence-associated protein VapD
MATSISGIGHNRPRGRQRVYAITFDFDTELLEQPYHNEPWRNTYTDARRFVENNGFENKQGSVYFALDEIDETDCIAVVQDLADELDWFTPSLRNIRMLRIEENNDLMTILDRKRRRRRPS